MIPPVPIPSSSYRVNVQYIPQTTGCHTICYRMKLYTPSEGPTSGPDPSFCCFNDITITPAQVGVVRSVIVDVGVDFDTCPDFTYVGKIGSGTYVYEGYVYPCCDISQDHGLKVDWPNPLPEFVIALP